MTYWVISFLALIIIAILRYQHQKYHQKKFIYKLYELRDRVRYMQATGEFDKQEPWVFNYFEESFSKVIGQSFYLTVYALLCMLIRNEDSINLDGFQKTLDEATSSNESLLEIREEYTESMVDYIQGQHQITFQYIFKPIFVAVVGIVKFNTMFKKVLVYPESSVSRKYQGILATH